MKKHYAIMICWHPTRGFIQECTVWATDIERAKIDFINNNKDRLRPFDRVDVWRCSGCEECSDET